LVLAVQAVVVIALPLLSALRIVGFRYPRVVENDPLIAPVKVLEVTDNKFVLADGRELVVDGLDERVGRSLRESNFRVDLEPQGDSGFVVHVKERGRIGIEELPTRSLVNIPLVPNDIPINHRKTLTTAHLLAADLPHGEPQVSEELAPSDGAE
jgi:hypothetical protein